MTPSVRAAGPRDEAVSSVVGTVLLLGVTVVVFAGLSLAVLAAFEGGDAAPRAELAAEARPGSLLVLHRGGEPVALDGAALRVNVAGEERRVEARSLPGAAALGPTLDLGEALCVQGADPARCLHPPSADVRGVLLVSGNAVLARSGERGSVGGP